MVLALLILYVSANELYNFNRVDNIHDREPICTMENEVCTARFYTSSLPSNRIFIHQNLASVVHKLSTIGEIRTGGYIIRPFHSIWSENNQKCLGLYRYSFKDKNLYGQMHGNTRVTFSGSIGEPVISENKVALDVSGELFLKVIDSLISFDYTMSSHQTSGSAGLDENFADKTETHSGNSSTQQADVHTENHMS